MKLKIVFTTAVLIIGGVFSLHAETIRLEELSRLVRERNERVQAARSLLKAEQARAENILRSFLPEITAEGGRETFRTGVEDRRTESFGSVGAEINVFRSGQDELKARQWQANGRVAQARYDEVYRSELLKALETFWTLVFQREMTKHLKDALELNHSLLKAANKKIASGLSTSTDRLEFEIARRQWEQDITRLQSESSRAEKTLGLLTGTVSPVETPEKIPHDHDDPLLYAAFNANDHPSVKALDAMATADRLEARTEKRWWVPSVDLYSNYSLYTFREREFEERSDRDETVLGGKLSLPLYDKGVSYRQSGAHSLKADGTLQEKNAMEKEITLNVESDRATLVLLHELVHSAEEGVNMGEEYLRTTLNEYSRGVKNSPDLLGALEKLVEVKHRDAEMRLDYQLIKARLASMLGY